MDILKAARILSVLKLGFAGARMQLAQLAQIYEEISYFFLYVTLLAVCALSTNIDAIIYPGR